MDINITLLQLSTCGISTFLVWLVAVSRVSQRVRLEYEGSDPMGDF